MPWSPIQRDVFLWACFGAPDVADAILLRDGDEAAQLPLLRQAWSLRAERDPAWADRQRQDRVSRLVLDHGLGGEDLRRHFDALDAEKAKRTAPVVAPAKKGKPETIFGEVA